MELVHDVVNQKLPVLFAIDRAGLVGADGPTHNGSYDISFLRCLPEIVIADPIRRKRMQTNVVYRVFLLTGRRLFVIPEVQDQE